MLAAGELAEKESDGDVSCIDHRESTFYPITSKCNLGEFDTIERSMLVVTAGRTLFRALFCDIVTLAICRFPREKTHTGPDGGYVCCTCSHFTKVGV